MMAVNYLSPPSTYLEQDIAQHDLWIVKLTGGDTFVLSSEVGGDERQRLRATSRKGGRAVAGRYQLLQASKNGAIRVS